MAVWSSSDVNDTKSFEDIIFTYASIKGGQHHYRVKFSAFVTGFSDNFTQAWSTTSVYGKQDSIETYQGTRRMIDLSWDVPSNGPKQGWGNMVKLETLIKMLYPMYDVQSTRINAATINKPPLLRLKFANLIKNHKGEGLLGHVNGFTFNPSMEHGMYNTNNTRQKAIGIPNFGLIPKVYSMSCQFTVLHEQDLGFKSSDNRFFNSIGDGESGFPYGFTGKRAEVVAVNKGTTVSPPSTGVTTGQEKKITGG